CNAAKALDLVEQTLDARLFAPRTAAAPVQIMGYLETTGLRFTHLWIAGMQDSAWPGPANPNPFIPIATQRRAGVPRIDQRSELDFAQSRIEHWLASSKTLVISHVVDDGEAQHLASPLTEEIDLHPTGSVIKGWRQRSHPYLTPRANLLERFDDSTGTRLSGGRHRGGSGLLRDQATCPFRAWAIHRLRLREVRQPHAFPDALDRGNLVHEALHGLLLPFTEPRDDRRYPDEVNPAALAAAADSALEARYGRFPSLFRSRERARLISLLASWVELERERGEFQVVELESDAELLVAELQLRLRLDRVDQVGDRRVIIDYKTGGIQPGRLLSPRLQEPQLPAYAVSHEGVAAVLFGQAVDPNPRLAGLAAEDLDAEPARLQPLPVGGWRELASTWRGQLETLATEFGSGHAAVDPVNADACQHCHLQSLCRIRDEEPNR
ncbi:MAG: PD-(D/E)XK nuclease family protein, partial [Gammaproteobacteria bacterium]|nr:PD-(D/E)XK nuclease family protein [Gammaproteobacteria bacterium]